MLELPFKMHCDNEITKFRASTFWSKEPETLEWLRVLLTVRDTGSIGLVDIGANVGIYSLFAASLCSAHKILAIEPFDINFWELKRNVTMNNFSNQIECVLGAVSDHSGAGSLSVADSRCGSTGAQVTQLPPSEVLDSRNQSIRIYTGDFLTQRFVAKKHLTGVIAKIDTDGHELNILHGMKEVLGAGVVLSILCETNQTNKIAITDFLASFKFLEDQRFEDVLGHSTTRRTLAGKTERTVVYTQMDHLKKTLPTGELWRKLSL